MANDPFGESKKWGQTCRLTYTVNFRIKPKQFTTYGHDIC